MFDIFANSFFKIICLNIKEFIQEFWNRLLVNMVYQAINDIWICIEYIRNQILLLSIDEKRY